MAAPMWFVRKQSVGIVKKYVRLISVSTKTLKRDDIASKRSNDIFNIDPFNSLVETLPELPRRNLTPKKKPRRTHSIDHKNIQEENTDKIAERRNLKHEELKTTELKDDINSNKRNMRKKNSENRLNGSVVLSGLRHVRIDQPTFFTRKMLDINHRIGGSGEDFQKNLVLHGTKTIAYAMEAGLRPMEMYVAEERKAKYERFLSKYNDLLEKTTIYWLHENYLKIWYNDEINVSAFFLKPEIKAEEEGRHPLTLVLDRIDSSEVLGKLLHFAYENKFEDVYVLMNCVDPWSNDAVLHSKGAHFKMPVSIRMIWADILFLLPKDRTMIAIGTNQELESQLACNQSILDETLENVRKDEWFGDDKESKLEDDEFSDTEISTKDNTPTDYKNAKLHVEPLENVDFTGEYSVIVISGKTGLTTTTRRHVYDSYGVAVESPDDCVNKIKFLEEVLKKACSEFQKSVESKD